MATPGKRRSPFRFVVSLFLLQPAICLATVGGADSVHKLLWDKQQQRVWFVRAVGGGQGRELGYFSAKNGQRKLFVAARDSDDDEDKRTAALHRRLARVERRSKPLQLVSPKHLSISATAQARLPALRGGRVRDPGQYFDTLKGVSLPWSVAIKAKGRLLGSKTVSACDFSKRGVVSGFGVSGRGFLVLVISTTGVCIEGGYRTDELLFVRRAGLKRAHFLKAFASDYPPEKILGNPTGTAPFALAVRQLATTLDTMGSRAYKAGALKAAASYFHRAVYFQTGEPFAKGAHKLVYPIALFHLAATLARRGSSEQALDRLKLLLSNHKIRSGFRKKVRTDTAFDSLRGQARYKALLR